MSIARTLLKPAAYLASLHARSQASKFLSAHKDTAGVQHRLLMEMVRVHENTDFGRDHDFASVRSVDDFRRAVPVGSYDSVAPYMTKVLAGQTTALLPEGESVLMFSMTSGTTGQPKYIPVTQRFLSDIRRGWNIWGIRCLLDHKSAWLRNILQISSSMNEARSPTNLPCGAISGLLAATQKKIVQRMYVVPRWIAEVSDPVNKYYLSLRYSIGRDVSSITTANPSSTIKLIEIGQANAQRLIKDVRDGTITPPNGDEPLVANCGRPIKANARLADRMEKGLAADGQLLPKHFWNLSFLANWTGGTLGLFMPRIRELYGDVPVRDIGLLASEGRFSIPITDFTAGGVAEITGNFLEFIPAEDRQKENPPTLLAHELEVGAEYFLVFSNWTGLFRYNLDDRIRVNAKFGQSPVIEFLSRGLHTANITGEKVTENQAVLAMSRATEKLAVKIQRFVMQGRFASVPFYELRIEQGDGVCDEVSAGRLSAAVDDALSELNIEYASKRKSGRLGPIRAVLMPAGHFEFQERQNIIARHGRGEQYKHQYLLTQVLS